MKFLAEMKFSTDPDIVQKALVIKHSANFTQQSVAKFIDREKPNGLFVALQGLLPTAGLQIEQIAGLTQAMIQMGGRAAEQMPLFVMKLTHDERTNCIETLRLTLPTIIKDMDSVNWIC